MTSYDILKTKQRELRVAFPPTMSLRVHRSISWIGRAEKEEGDTDAQFVFLWIAFNAAYADERALAVSLPGKKPRLRTFSRSWFTSTRRNASTRPYGSNSQAQFAFFSRISTSSALSGSSTTVLRDMRTGRRALPQPRKLWHLPSVQATR